MREFKDKIITLRKSRKCDWCERQLLAGHKARYMVGFEEGHFRAAYYCKECQEELFKDTCYKEIKAGSWEMI